MVTFNVQHGRVATRKGPRWRTSGVDSSLLARHCAGFGAAILALQEVDVRIARSGWVDQAALVAEETGLVHAFGEARPVGLFGRYGNALLAGQALDDVQVVPLPRIGAGETRVAIVATVTAADQTLSVAATHLSTDRGEAGEQLQATIAALDERPLPRVVLGDLNLVAEDVRPLVGEAGLELVDPAVPTYPAAAPRLRIDHVAVAGLGVAGLAVAGTEVLPAAPVSDHRPLAVEVRSAAPT